MQKLVSKACTSVHPDEQQIWHWGQAQVQAFQEAEALQTDTLLVHYDTTKPLVLACNASQYGNGAVLSHIVDHEQERPVTYVSRALSALEKHYSQLEKEALAILSSPCIVRGFIHGNCCRLGWLPLVTDP